MKERDGAFGFFALIAIVAGLFWWLTKRTTTAMAAANTANPANAAHPVFTIATNRPSVIGQNAQMGTTAAATAAGAAAAAGWLNSLFEVPQPVVGAVPGVSNVAKGTGAVATSIVNNPTVPVFMPSNLNGNNDNVTSLINSFSSTTPAPILDNGIVLDPYNSAVYNTDASFVDSSIVPITSDTSDTGIGV